MEWLPFNLTPLTLGTGFGKSKEKKYLFVLKLQWLLIPLQALTL